MTLSTKHKTGFLLFAFIFIMWGRTSAQFPKELIPTSAVVQYAGSIGYLSAGIGYELFHNERGSLDLMYGRVPEKKGGKLDILAVKFAYRPIEVKLNNWANLYPINPGVFVSYHLGPKFNFQWDKDVYEKGYYWWSSALRPHVSLGTEVKLNTSKVLPSLRLKSLSFYSEFNTNELYLISYFQNTDGLSLTDIFKLGIGMRIEF